MHAQKFMEGRTSYKNDTEHGFELKIGSRYANIYDYGEHLLRMLKRGLSFDEFLKKYYFRAEYCQNIEMIEPEHCIVTAKEFFDMTHQAKYIGKNIKYKPHIAYMTDIRQIEKNMLAGVEFEFYIQPY